jgi:hypothetical protein
VRTGARGRGIAVAFAFGVACAGAGASPAAANTYCVRLQPCPQNGPNYQTLQAALDAAENHDGEDNIQIGPVKLHNTHAVDHEGNVVAIYGRGASTVLIADGPTHGPDAALSVGDPNTGVNELAIQVTRPSDGIGLRLGRGGAFHVRVTAAPTVAGGAVGVTCDGDGAEFLSGVVALPLKTQTFGLQADNGCLVRDSTITASFGVDSSSGAVRVARSSLFATYALSVGRTANVTAEDDVIVGRPTPTASGGTAAPTSIGVRGTGSSTASVSARHLTLFGGGDPRAVAVQVGSDPGKAATVSVHDSIIRGYGYDLLRQPPPPDGHATIAIDYSDYATARVRDDAPGQGGSILHGSHSVNDVAPLFAIGGRDFHLRSDSPLIDIGDPGGFTPGESRTDRDREPRIVDGDGHPGARRDMGAYEAPMVVPPPTHVIKGTGKGDERHGSKSRDVFRLGAGGDTAFGGRGGDWLFGQAGADELHGDRGFDRLFGGGGGDVLDGGPQGDRLFGGDGPDHLGGRAGLDSFDAGSGDDFVDSADGIHEVVFCGKGFDSGKADKGDTLFGCEAVKRVSGGSSG